MRNDYFKENTEFSVRFFMYSIDHHYFKCHEIDSEVYANNWKSPETIIDAMYSTISVGPNHNRNWATLV